MSTRGIPVAQLPEHVKVQLGPNSPLRKTPKARKPRRERQDQEHAEQVKLFAWAREHEAEIPALALLYAVPNYSGDLSPAIRARLQAEGKKPGVPDVCLPVPRAGSGSLYLEMKSDVGQPSEAQVRWLMSLRQAGNRAEIANSAAVAIAIILDYLGVRPSR